MKKTKSLTTLDVTSATEVNGCNGAVMVPRDAGIWVWLNNTLNGDRLTGSSVHQFRRNVNSRTDCQWLHKMQLCTCLSMYSQTLNIRVRVVVITRALMDCQH